MHLLECWARRTLDWINRYSNDGPEPFHTEWGGLVFGMGDNATIADDGDYITGKFLDVDENFDILFRDGEVSNIISLFSRLEKVQSW